MQFMTDALLDAIHEYKLEVAGVQVWTPYWINLDLPPFRLNAPLRGKGTAQQLTTTLEEVVGSTEVKRDAEAIRELMREHGLGEDCAGFAYNVLNRVLGARGERLADVVTVPRSYVQGALERFPERARPELSEPLPETVPLGWLFDLWDKAPVDLVNVRRFRDHSTVVEHVADIKPGNLVGWIGDPSVPADDHIGVVVECTASELIYWSSDNDNEAGPYGGVVEHRLPIKAVTGRITDQDWPLSKGRTTQIWQLNG